MLNEKRNGEKPTRSQKRFHFISLSRPEDELGLFGGSFMAKKYHFNWQVPNLENQMDLHMNPIEKMACLFQ